jgi:hypothetical protein
MVIESKLQVPEGVSFEQAIALTQSLLAEMEQGTIAETGIGETVAALVQSQNGARGFFVTYLSDDRALIDQFLPAVVPALKGAPDVVAPLLVKNLVMSTAMAITHRRNQNQDLAAGSNRVRLRSVNFVTALALPQLREQAQQLAVAIREGTGDYATFLDRWGYDTEQKQAMLTTLEQVGLVGES